LNAEDTKPFALGRIFGVRVGTLTAIAGIVFMQLGFQGIAPLSWPSPGAASIAGMVLYVAGLTWNGLGHLLERLEQQ